MYQGLSDAQVEESRLKNGSNEITPLKKRPLWELYFKKFGDPLIIILMVIGVFALLVSSYECWILKDDNGIAVFFEPIGIFVAIMLATGIGFYYELKAQKEFTVLNKENDKAPVLAVRNGNVVSIPKCDVVVGDILVLQTGQEVPADAKILESVNLTIDESTLTGEPAHRKSANISEGAETTYPINQIYRGTEILEGHGYAEVFAVGDKTENGRLLRTLTNVEIDEEDEEDSLSQLDETQKRAYKLQQKETVTKEVKTPLNEQLDGLAELITNISYVFAGAIIVAKLLVYFNLMPWDLNVWYSFLWNPWVWALIIPTSLFFFLVIKKFEDFSKLTCISIIAVFFALFIGIVVLMHNILLPSVEMSHLITYSLETVMIAVTLVVVAVPEGLPMAVSLALANSMRKMNKTNNLVRKMHACETMGAATVICTDKTGTLTNNQMLVKECDMANEEYIYEAIAANSTASLDFSKEKPKVLGNPTEGALLLWLKSLGKDYVSLRESVDVIKEIPFSTEKKYMATLLVSSAFGGKKVLYVKGAPEIVLEMSSSVLPGKTKEEYLERLLKYQNAAMRTLGFAYQIVNNESEVILDDKLITRNLTFCGIVGIEDSVRDGVIEAVGKCLDAGIEVKIVTGDTIDTAREIGKQIGIWKSSYTERNIIDGQSFALLSHEELLERVDELKIIARARPLDKKRLVEALQEKNHVVAVTGDGTNDAPALNAAHVGLSMGSGTNVAMQASDITIKDNSFASIERAVQWGRSLFQNIQRFLLFQLTVNVAACMLVLCGAFMGTQSPLTVTQMLWVNLIMDTFAAFALSSLPPTDKVMKDKPRDRNAFILDKNMMLNIFGVGLFFFFLLLGLLYVFQHSEINQLTDLLQVKLNPTKGKVSDYELTLLFTIFVMTHFWYLFNARAYKTNKSGILNLKGCGNFLIIVFAILIGQILMVQIPVFNSFFNVVQLKPVDWGLIISLSALVMIIRDIYNFFKTKLL